MTGHEPDADEPGQGGAGSPLTYYGELARRGWEQRLPGLYALIRDPVAFFVVVGESIAEDIDELAGEIAGDDPPGEGHLAKVARLGVARVRAESMVLGGHGLLPPAADGDNDHHHGDHDDHHHRGGSW